MNYGEGILIFFHRSQIKMHSGALVQVWTVSLRLSGLSFHGSANGSDKTPFFPISFSLRQNNRLATDLKTHWIWGNLGCRSDSQVVSPWQYKAGQGLFCHFFSLEAAVLKGWRKVGNLMCLMPLRKEWSRHFFFVNSVQPLFPLHELSFRLWLQTHQEWNF